MARPCGCGGGGVVVRCGTGMQCSGIGTATDPLVVGWQIPLSTVACNAVMDCVGGHVGEAFFFNSTTKSLNLRIDPDPDNMITVGPAGVMVAPVAPSPTDGGATVAKLLTLPTPLIGGSYGAGFSQFPEGHPDIYEAAVNLVPEALDLVHVPVRATRDLFPICVHDSNLGFYNPVGNESFRSLDQKQITFTEVVPSIPPVEENGYFGFSWPTERGVPQLGEVFNLLGNKTVLYLEVKDRTSPVDAYDRIKRMLPGWNMNKSVIIAGEPITTTSGTGPTIMHAMTVSFAGTGIPMAAHLTDVGQVNTYTPAALQSLGIGWVSLPYFIGDPEHPNYIPGAVQAYKDAGIQVMIHTVHRQFQYQLAVTNGMRGVLCNDPIYASGVRSGYRYRRDGSLYGWNLPKYGVHSAWSYQIDGSASIDRGFIRPGLAEEVVFHQLLHNPNGNAGFDGSGYWMLMGTMGPYRNADRYAVQMWCWWDRMIVDTQRWIGMFLDRDNDRVLYDWSSATIHTKGYLVSLSQNGNIVVSWYKGTPAPGNGTAPPDATTLFAGASGYTIAPRTFYGLRVEMDNTQMRVYRTGTNLFSAPKTLVTTLNGITRYITGTNKGYPFMARHFFNTTDACETRFGNPSVSYTL